MRFRFRYSLTTLLLLPLLVGIGIKVYHGPHEYTLAEEREWQRAELRAASNGQAVFVCDTGPRPPEGTFWALREFDGRLLRHGPEISIDDRGYKRLVEYQNGKRHGLYRQWDRAAELSCTGQFEQGQQVGEWLYYSQGQIWRSVVYEPNRETEREFDDTNRLTMESVTDLNADRKYVTEWSTNGRKRFHGSFALSAELPDGIWCWWDEKGNEVRTQQFQEGIPEELNESPLVVQFMRSNQVFDFQDVTLQDALDFIRDHATLPEFIMRLDCGEADAKEICQRRLTTPPGLNGPAALYVALRDAGLTLDTGREENNTETLVVRPVNAP